MGGLKITKKWKIIFAIFFERSFFIIDYFKYIFRTICWNWQKCRARFQSFLLSKLGRTVKAMKTSLKNEFAFFWSPLGLFQHRWPKRSMLPSPGGLLFDSRPQCLLTEINGWNVTHSLDPHEWRRFLISSWILSIELCGQDGNFNWLDCRKLILRHHFVN